MRLEPLCRLTMRYAERSWRRPFGGDGAGYGWGIEQEHPERFR